MDRVYIAQGYRGSSSDEPFRCFRPEHALTYNAHSDDFGPLTVSCIERFIKALDQEFTSFPGTKIVFCVGNGSRNLTNAVFLLGSYMILKDRMTPNAVAARIRRHVPESGLLDSYRDATYEVADFGLSLLDCWRGLAKGEQKGWVRFSSSALWGDTNLDQYRYFENPSNGDLHKVIPGKFVVLKGPEDIGDCQFRDMNGERLFSPSYY